MPYLHRTSSVGKQVSPTVTPKLLLDFGFDVTSTYAITMLQQ